MTNRKIFVSTACDYRRVYIFSRIRETNYASESQQVFISDLDRGVAIGAKKNERG